MSDESKKLSFVIVTMKMPDGKEHEIPIPAKFYRTGRTGWYTQIPPFVYDGEIYGGQIQIWTKKLKLEGSD